MCRCKLWVPVVSSCLLVVGSALGQVQKSAGGRSPEAASTILEPEDSNALGSSSTTKTGPTAVVPRLMKFSGALLDASGKPLSGAVDVTFSLYGAEVGGAPLWFETQSVQADELGRYTALLGAMHTDGLPLDLFTSGEAHWLGIQVGLEPEQQPRVLLVSVPYALKAGDAETLGGKPASAYMLSDSQAGPGTPATSSTSNIGTSSGVTAGKGSKTHTANTSALTACTAVTSDGTAVASAIAMFTTACNIEISNMYQSSGNIGIGTASPQALLDVENGTIRLGRTGTWPVIFNQTGGSVFTITNGGTNQMAFDYNGNLGIGTATPGAKVDIVGGDLRIGLKGTWPVVFDQSAASIFTIANGGIKRLALDYNGNLGIGTTSPGSALHIMSATTPTLIANNTTGGKVLSLQNNGTEVFSVDGSGNVISSGSVSGAGLNVGTYDTYVGISTPVPGSNWNTGMGSRALASMSSGSENTAMGFDAMENNSAGSYNTAVGATSLLNNHAHENTAVGAQALYDNSDANGNTAVGYNALTYNCKGVSSGCTALYNTALGFVAGSPNSTNANAAGGSNTFIGAWSGPGTASVINNATAIGANSVVSQSNSLVLGSINGVNNATSSVNVGIGTATPGDWLDVNIGSSGPVNTGVTIEGSSSTFGDLGLKIHNTGTGGVNWYLDSTNNSSGYGGGNLMFVTGPGGTPVMGMASAGYVQLGCSFVSSLTTYTLYVHNVCGNGKGISAGWDTYSSRRFKTNIETLHSGLSMVERLRGVTYNDKSDGKPEVGVIAEEVAQVLPQVVGYDNSGEVEGVDYSRLTAVLIEATKEQQHQINAQQKRIRELTREVTELQKARAQTAALEARLALLEAKVGAAPRTETARVKPRGGKATRRPDHKTPQPALPTVAGVRY